MNKEEFLLALKEKLSDFPEADALKAVDFYNEMICDRMENGMSEEEAVADVGTPDEIALEILYETPLPKLVKAKAKPNRELKAWEIVLLCLGFPIWGSLLCAALAAVLSVYCVLWSVVITFYAMDFALAVSGVALIAAGAITLFRAVPAALLILGAGFICLGLSILLFFVSNMVAGGMIAVSRFLTRQIKSLFIRKGEKK